MSFKAYVKKFQSIEDGTISVLLKVPAEDANAVMALYQKDVIVSVKDDIPYDRRYLLADINMQLHNIARRLDDDIHYSEENQDTRPL